MEHHFNTLFAKKYGVNEAIFCNNLYFWIKKNQANRKHIYDGNIWTYNSVEAFSEIFEYWTPKQIRTIISNCKKKGLIVQGNYNLRKYDKTFWYALTDKVFEIFEGKPLDIPHLPKRENEAPHDLPKWANAFDQMGKPIPDSNTDLKQKKEEEEEKLTHLTELTDFFFKNISATGKQLIETKLDSWLKILPFAVIKAELENCALHGAKSWQYVERSLNDLKETNVTTIEQLQQKHAEYQEKSKEKKQKSLHNRTRSNKKGELLPDWFDQPEKELGGARPEAAEKQQEEAEKDWSFLEGLKSSSN